VIKAMRFAILWLALGASTTAVAQEQAPSPITVEPTTQMRFGLSIATLKAAVAPSGMPATAHVLDPSRLVLLDSDLAVASAAFSASLTETIRLRKEYSEERTTANRSAVATASHEEQADLQKVNEARRKLAIEWGGGVADLTARKRSELLTELSGGQAALARVDIPAGALTPSPGTALELRGRTETELFSGRVLGSLPSSDPQNRGVLVQLKGEAAKLPVNQELTAQIPAPNAAAGPAGVLLPRSAVVRHGSHVWAYVQTGPNTFVRREVRDYQALSTGWFVPSGFSVGDRIVAAGAGSLLGVEGAAVPE
jgi:hypothetical protein